MKLGRRSAARKAFKPQRSIGDCDRWRPETLSIRPAAADWDVVYTQSCRSLQILHVLELATNMSASRCAVSPVARLPPALTAPARQVMASCRPCCRRLDYIACQQPWESPRSFTASCKPTSAAAAAPLPPIASRLPACLAGPCCTPRHRPPLRAPWARPDGASRGPSKRASGCCSCRSACPSPRSSRPRLRHRRPAAAARHKWKGLCLDTQLVPCGARPMRGAHHLMGRLEALNSWNGRGLSNAAAALPCHCLHGAATSMNSVNSPPLLPTPAYPAVLSMQPSSTSPLPKPPTHPRTPAHPPTPTHPPPSHPPPTHPLLQPGSRLRWTTWTPPSPPRSPCWGTTWRCGRTRAASGEPSATPALTAPPRCQVGPPGGVRMDPRMQVFACCLSVLCSTCNSRDARVAALHEPHCLTSWQFRQLGRQPACSWQRQGQARSTVLPDHA